MHFVAGNSDLQGVVAHSEALKKNFEEV